MAPRTIFPGKIALLIAVVVAALFIVLGLLQPLVTPVTTAGYQAFFMSSFNVTGALLVALFFVAQAMIQRGRVESLKPGRAKDLGLRLVANVVILSFGLFAAVFGILFGASPGNMVVVVLATWVLGIMMLAEGIYVMAAAPAGPQ